MKSAFHLSFLPSNKGQPPMILSHWVPIVGADMNYCSEPLQFSLLSSNIVLLQQVLYATLEATI